MSLANNKKSAVIAFICTVIAIGVMGYLAFSNPNLGKPKKTASVVKNSYVVAAADIKAGSLIKEEDIELQEFGIVFKDAYTQKSDVAGKISAKDVEKGKLIFSVKEEKEAPKTKEPVKGFSAFPITVQKSSLPPYVIIDKKFDLQSKENVMFISNVKILDLVDVPNNTNSKMLLLEIKNSDIQEFTECLEKTKGLYFLQKSPEDEGEYQFITQKPEEKKPEIPKITPKEELPIPSISDISEEIASEIKEKEEIKEENGEVEVIIGSRKQIMDFKK